MESASFNNPHNRVADVELIQNSLLVALSEHWREYQVHPIGDEEAWDTQLTESLRCDFGLTQGEASQLNQVAKLNAQFED